MIVVWVNKRNWKKPGPIVNMAVHNAASFSSLGYESHLVIGQGSRSDTDVDLDSFYGIAAQPGFKVHRVPSYRVGAASYRLSVFFYAYRLIRELSLRDQVVVFTRESAFLLFLARLRQISKRIMGFYELHDLFADLSWVDEKRSHHYREKFYEHLMLPKMDGIVCITREQEKRYNAIFPKLPSCTFPLGTKPVSRTYDPEKRRRQRTLMYVGHMHEGKGVDFLLQAAQRLAPHGVRFSFWGGKEKKVPAFEKRAEKMGISSHVRFVPFQPPEVLHRALTEEASLGTVMLHDTYYNRYLTCPVKALDYLSHGIPALGSDIPSVREVLGDAGTYVPHGNLDAFTGEVLRLLDDPLRYSEMVRQSRLRAHEITWQKRAIALLAFADSVRQGKR